MKVQILPVVLASTLLLSACASLAAAQPTTAAADPPTLAAPMNPTSSLTQPNDGMTRVDQQGMVIVEVTPLNLQEASPMLDFDVAMNTHSVDLSMDLSQLATLATDTGIRVQAAAWDAPAGGHHVNGKLSFPATHDGKSVLDGASKLTLTIVSVDAPVRIFEWQLQ